MVQITNATRTVSDAGAALAPTAKLTKDTCQTTASICKETMITAVRNITDQLHARPEAMPMPLRAARDFERAAKTSFDLANQQMQSGNANVLLLLNAQQSYLQSVIQVVQAQAARLSDTAALFQALGGGWWNRAEPPAEQISRRRHRAIRRAGAVRRQPLRSCP